MAPQPARWRFLSPKKFRRQISSLILAPLILSCGILAVGPLQPGHASDRIVLSYGPVQLPVSLDSLEAYAQSGTIEPELALYLQQFSPALQARLRNSLRAQLQLPPQQLTQFLNSPMGNRLLSSASVLAVQPDALRQAILQAAEQGAGLSLLTVLRQFPETAQIDVRQVARLWQHYESLAQQTQQFIERIETVTEADRVAIAQPKTSPAPSSALPQDPQQSGPYKFELRPLQLHDAQRDRSLDVDFYWPQSAKALKTPQKPQGSGAELRSLVVISHGLGANRQGHAFFARHLASHGIAVAVLQHPGSDSQQVRALFQGQAPMAMEPRAFIERPRDVSFLLDELERRNISEFDGQLQLDQVGMYGHSLGAYTALTLAGATLNFDQLQTDCQPEAYLLDLSMVLQCQALELPQQDYSLKDERIGALLLLDPVSRSILAPAQETASPQEASGLAAVELPVFWGGSSADVITPLPVEQLPAFQQLGSRQKYFSLVDQVQHMNIQLDRLARTSTPNSAPLVEAKPEVFQGYMNALGLAFVQVYVGDRPEYRSYLHPSYAQQLSQDPYTLRLLTPSTLKAEY